MARHHRTAAILSIGDEITLGQKLDTNSKWLADQLTTLGITVSIKMTVPDDLAALAARFKELAETHDLVLSTGGLGPTADDLTRLALAKAIGDEVVEDAEALSQLLAWFDGVGRKMPEANRVQAMRPQSATCLSNAKGTAPGLHAVVDGADVFCMPGPPREMQPMFERFVVPVLRTDRVVLTRVLPTVGLGESAIADRLGELMDRDRNPLVGTTASASIVTCRIRYEGDDTAEGERRLDETVELVRGKIGDIVFADRDVPLAEVVLDRLRERRQTIATVESCTGGLVGEMLTEIPSSSDAYIGGWVTYTNAMKTSQVGVHPDVFEKHGAVSEECCRAMATGGRERSGSDYAISVTGIAGPGGGSAEKPVGTVWIGLASPSGVRAERFRFNGDREMIRQRSATAALAMLWKAIKEPRA
ncbi:MAG: competence/damage-inducible protein A [Phycisphaerales bacterium]|nr:competence/damage-inducible protein A [Phycisphaerales bacterium]MCB9836308.1 competence/damage-inducible protein A [Phycisphaera sp.]